MKFLILLVIVGSSLAATRTLGRRSLPDDFNDFIELLDFDTLDPIVDNALATDPAVASIVEYLQNNFDQLIRKAVRISPAGLWFLYLIDAGIDVNDIIESISTKIASTSPGVEGDSTASVRPFLDELKAALPLAEWGALLDDKLQNSVDFQDLYKEIATEEGKAFADEFLRMPEAAQLVELLTNEGADVDGALSAIYEFFGWGAPRQRQ